MKRRLTALALALGLTFTLAACGGGTGGTANTPSNNSESPAGNSETPAAESDMAYVKEKGTLVVGMTDFKPMDYKDENGEWIGFDADMAKAFAESLGVEVEFIEINWDNKLMELDTKGIDVIWNGMTINDEVKAGASVSEPYCRNGQVVVVPADKAEDYQTVESLSGLNFAVENGSQGAAQLDELGLTYVAKTTQADALMEVASGASDACVIDLLMAGAMIGEGTSYPDLTYTVQLNDEEYGVAFRKGSDLTEAFNTFWKEAYDAGTVMETATTYGVQESVIEK
ncbi:MULTISPECIES: transporter substrate-binding domain-containing protein [unclassified Flavonifractor]|uniref:transporter substrate-binding domain-containing protein n=1 Tax=unclassified Flavonifractor TaxID=2629267 RepID=UPI000B397EF4|nr:MULTISPECIES: transporter substrate-binding domain-containing protein [unclassified Flavonifractor]OUN12664.1 amino acid ABC transporter substrate-binding protein [Flavonifractor sp. An9]OUQ61282.1 amino acid ABC transporter substrate-binding protein [Flavonifractor sp. An112]HIZ94321.1 transporter substrate-binding domain-containing protein [Candidatus Flavonifractor avicola]